MSHTRNKFRARRIIVFKEVIVARGVERINDTVPLRRTWQKSEILIFHFLSSAQKRTPCRAFQARPRMAVQRNIFGLAALQRVLKLLPTFTCRVVFSYCKMLVLFLAKVIGQRVKRCYKTFSHFRIVDRWICRNFRISIAGIFCRRKRQRTAVSCFFALTERGKISVQGVRSRCHRVRPAKVSSCFSFYLYFVVTTYLFRSCFPLRF